MSKVKFNTIEEAVEDIRNGKIVIVVDDEDRENEGDLLMAAEKVTPEAINFMIKNGRGLVCLPMLGERLDQLELMPMSDKNTESMRTAFTISIDAHSKFGVTTGISPSDRARTIETAINNKTKKEDLLRPGHIFPLRAMEGGVLKRAGHTEAAVDLAMLSGLYPAGIICEIIKENGQMARVPDLIKFAHKHQLKLITIKELIGFRLKKEKLIKHIATVNMPTEFGDFIAHTYEDLIEHKHHVALVKGKISKKQATLVRVHSECLTGDVFASQRCDCGNQLHKSMQMIEENKNGVLLYMRQEGRGIGLENKLKAYALQDQGKDTVEANIALGFAPDLRNYGIGAQILADLKISIINLITNNPRKIVGLEGYGLKVEHRIPIEVEPNQHNRYYLETKVKKLGHIIKFKKNKSRKEELRYAKSV